MGDNSVLDIRSRQIDVHALDQEKIKANANFYKVVNLLVPILLVLIFALLMAYLRKNRFAKIR